MTLLHCLLTARETISLSGLACVPLASSLFASVLVEIIRSLRTEKLTGAPCRSEKNAYLSPRVIVPMPPLLFDGKRIILHISGSAAGDRGEERIRDGIRSHRRASIQRNRTQAQLAGTSNVHVPVRIKSSVDVQLVRYAITKIRAEFEYGDASRHAAEFISKCGERKPMLRQGVGCFQREQSDGSRRCQHGRESRRGLVVIVRAFLCWDGRRSRRG